MDAATQEPVNLVDRLRTRAADAHDDLAYTFLADGETESLLLTYGELDRRARALGVWLQQAGLAGERALLLYPPGLEFVAAFLGCLYGGVTAVPAYPPGSRRTLPRLAAIARDAGPAVVLTSASHLERFRKLASAAPELDALTWTASDGPDMTPELADRWRPFHADEDVTAFLQYTSGSTSAPKGVRVTHGNLAANEEMIRRAFGNDEDTVVVGWLPFYHDMGLIGNVLQPLWVGAPCVLMSPWSFLQKPVRWLRAVSRYRATSSGGPNFAYDLCVRKTSPEERRSLDLSSWRLAFNGAEPVRAATLESFAHAFGPCGFRAEAWYPCYGLAEATLFVTGGAVETAPEIVEVEANRRLVSCGAPAPGLDLRIVDPESAVPCAPGAVGEIWVAGPSVADGYRNLAAASEETFGARLAVSGEGPYLRTGDLGVLNGGELYVTGRLKDLVILRGRNLYPQDVEWSAESSHAALRPGGAAAFSVEAEGEERLVVVQEVERRREAEAAEAADAVRRAVAEEHEARVWEVVITRAGAVPKTSSGKVRRGACRDAYLAGELKVVARSGLGAAADDEPLALTREAVLAVDPGERRALVEAFVRREAAAAARLPAARIDPDAPLTALGLDSLAAVELQHRLESDLEAEISMADLLAGASLGSVTAKVLEQVAGGRQEALPRMAAGGTAGEFSLSPGQEALWFLARLAPESTAYHLAGAARIRSDLDTAALERAFAALVARHGALRTTFHAFSGKPRQRLGDGSGGFTLEDAASWSEGRMRDRLAEEARRPFDLERGPVVRLLVLEAGRGEHRVLLAVHHLVADLWSLTVLLRELGQLYARETGGDAAPLPPPGVAYVDWVRHQDRLLAGREGERLERYWLERLAEVPRELEIPTDRPRPRVEGFRGLRVTRRLEAPLADDLHQLARTSGSTLFMVLLAAFQALLHRYSGQASFGVGSPSAGRRPAEAEGLVGYFVNPLVLAADFSGRPSGREALARVRETALGAFDHQGYPFPRLAERLEPERDAARSPLFQVMFALQKAHWEGSEPLAAFALGLEGVELNLGGLALESFALESLGAPFEVSLLAAEWQGGIALALEMKSDLWDRTTARRFLAHFERLSQALTEDPERAVAALAFLSPAERHELAVEWIRPAASYPADLTLPELFAAQARRTPDATAVVSPDGAWTYAELDRRADGLAERLRCEGVGPEVVVGLGLERGRGLVEALLALWKAGGVYLALDPDLPEERLAFLLEDTGAPLVVTRKSSADRFRKAGARVLCLAREKAAASARKGAGPIPANLAYVIYTSGSTGRPKGVAITHGNLSPMMLWGREALGLGRHTRVLHTLSPSFDFGVFEILTTLLFGGTFHMMEPDDLTDPERYARYIETREIDTLHATPSFIRGVVASGAGLRSLGLLHLGGEALSADYLDALFPALDPRCRVFNGYGPTEATINTTLFAVGNRRKRRDERRPVTPIGRPSASHRVYAVSGLGELVTAGVPGELRVSGDGLARGYLRRPALSAERWVPDGLGSVPGARLYRTGDRVRWLAAGEIEFLGRFDGQVKIRGFRVEPGEIEAALAGESELAAAAVVDVAASGTDRRLVAFVVPRTPGAAPPAAELRRRLERRLPAYMVPSAIVEVEALPTTASGKVDRRALRRAAPAAGDGGVGFTAPRTATEELLAEIWAGVLGVERVGVEDDFFALGGHSLLATQVVARIRDALGVELPLRRLFDHRTVAALAGEVTARRSSAASAPAVPPIRATPADGEAAPLSFAQERLWFLDRLYRRDPVYNMPAALLLGGDLDERALAAALTGVVRRHEALRTRFEVAESGPVQLVEAPRDDLLARVDLTGLDEKRRLPGALEVASREARRPFDLARGPLLRSALFRLGARQRLLFFVVHHVAFDGWSTGVLLGEIAALYGAFRDRRPAPLPELPIRYRDYARWQRAWLGGPLLAGEIAWWRERLSGVPALELATDRPRRPLGSRPGATLPVVAPEDLGEALAALGRRWAATPFMVLLAAWATLLGRFAGQADVAVGTPVANRRRTEIEPLIGFFANTLVLRVDLGGNPSFRGLLERARRTVLDADAHQDVPFEKLVQELEPRRDLATTPLFQTMLAFQSAPPPRLPELTVETLELGTAAARFDLTLLLGGGADLGGALEYDLGLFDPETAERIVGAFVTLLDGAVRWPESRLSELPLLTEAERSQVIETWNATARELPEACLHRHFESQADRTPEAVAVVFERRCLTYAELDRRANRLARRLLARGVAPEQRMGVMLERSPELMAALLAVAKAGAAYVPLDPTHPEERLAYVVEDFRGAQSDPLVVTLSALAPLLGRGFTTVAVDDETSLDADAARPEVAVDLDQAAYVIYTSGSTGRPKGTVNSHRGINNRLMWMLTEFGLRASDRVLQKTPFTFDVSVWELFAPLAAGARLVFARPGGHRDVAYLARLMRREAVTVAHFVPSMLRLFLDQPGLETLEALGQVVSSGEALAPELAAQARGRLPGARLHNLYGPTEAAVEVTWWTCPAAPAPLTRVPIGKPIANTRCYVLDRGARPVPAAVAGELHLGGVQVARGYFGRPGLTAERFVPDPFAVSGGRLYKTGDRARWLPDGEIEYLGRLDDQLKIRGFRIEPGEIEAALAAHPAVREAAVVGTRSTAGDPRIVAYLVVPEGGAPETAGLRRHLKRSLPDYMVPAAFVTLDALPVNASGKLDRGALARRELPAAAWEGATAAYTAPRTPVEEWLATAWSELLGVERVGVHDDFFELGGHSLLATRVASRVREGLGVEIPLLSFFERPTIAALAEEAESTRGEGESALPPLVAAARAGDTFPLSFAQERLWFLDRLRPGSAAYNISSAVRLEGRLAAGALGAAWQEIVRRHEALRTVFGQVGGDAVQRVTAPAEVRMPAVDLAGLDEGRRQRAVRQLAAGEAGHLFDLEAGPLHRALLLRLGPSSHVLVLTLHHIVSDGWSVGVLLRELRALYGAFASGQPSPLAELEVQYPDFAVWQRESLRGEVLERQIAYWRERLAGVPVLELPADRPRRALERRPGKTIPVLVPAELCRQLTALGRGHGATLYMTLLASFAALMARWSGQTDIAVGSPVANRRQVATEELIGFFVNTLVLRVGLGGDPAFQDLLGQVREITLEAQAHQDVPFAKVVSEIRPERHLDASPLFQVALALQNAPLGRLELPGLELDSLELESPEAKFDLTLLLGETGEGLAGTLEFDRALFDATTVRRMLGHWQNFLRHAASDSGCRVGELELLSAAERAALAGEWQTAGGYPVHLTPLDLFRAQAERAPESTAVVSGDELVSYGELDRRADEIARRLDGLGVGPEELVGVGLERGPEVTAVLFAIWKAGGVYVGLDPTLPRSRLAFMLDDTAARVLVTRQALAGSFPTDGMAVLLLDGAEPGRPAVAEAAERRDPAHPAYAIYTSGSTGRPKGVVIAHGPLAAHMLWTRDFLGLGSHTKMLQSMSHTFDFGIFEILTPLLFGGVLHWTDREQLADPFLHARYLERHGVNVRYATPSFIRNVTASGAGLAGLETLYVGGETMTPELLDGMFAAVTPECTLYNAYGPTEATVITTSFEIGTAGRRRDAGRSNIPIGRASANHRLHVVDGRGSPVPAGVGGELRVGGDCLGRGYLRRAAKTAERFVPDPFGGRRGGRLYRTGDRVRWLAGGEIEFLGRFDHQVKIRGFRVELGEIEALLSAQDGVAAAVVVDAPGPGGPGDRCLVAYLEAARPAAWSKGELVRRLEEALPYYMMPSAWVGVDTWPMTESGKIDRPALRCQAPEVGDSAGARKAPRTPTEEVLAGIWSEVLGTERPGVDESFFDLGGHSLLATLIMSRLTKTFGVELELRRLFEAPTIEMLARHVDAARRAGAPEAPPIEPAPRQPPPALSFAQERLWFLDQLEPGNTFYNVPMAVLVRSPLDLGRLEHCLVEVVRRHEVLRTTFPSREGRPFQEISPSPRLSLPVVDLTALSPDERRREARRQLAAEIRWPFDLPRGPLWRPIAFDLGGDETIFTGTIHHIAADGWSIGVLLSELFATYDALGRDEPATVPELPVQYADYAVWQRAWLAGENLERQMAYWRQQLAGLTSLELPTDRPRPAVEAFRGTQRPIALDGELTRGLEAIAVRHGVTLFMTLLAGMAAMLSRVSGQADLAVGSPIANRQRYETEHLIGFFANTLVLRADLGGDPAWSALLGRVREATLGAYAHQDVPFEKLVEELQPERDMSRNPLFQVMLVLQNQPVLEQAVEGRRGRSLDIEPLDVDMGIAKFDLTIFWRPAEGRLPGLLELNTDLFDTTTGLRMTALYEALLRALVADSEGRPDQADVLAPAERQQLLHEWNATREPELGQGCLHVWVEQQVERTPGDLAVIDGDRRLAYRELNERANQLAHTLIGLGVGPESLVGICVERSIEMVLGFLAVLKAGGAGVALDPAYPRERLAAIIRDAGLRVLLADRHLLESLPEHGGTNLLLDQGWGPFEGALATNPDVPVHPDHPIYAIYTSGSTGEPKGILVTHRAFGNLMEWQMRRSSMAPRARTVQFATFGFCVSFQEMFSSWCAGGTLVMAGEMVRRDINSLVSFLEEWEIERLHVPFAALKQLAEVSASSDRLPSRLMEVVSAGEQLQVSPSVRRLFERLEGCALRNQYGASETHVVADHCLTGAPQKWPSIPPVGRPVANVAIYLLDRHLEPVPLGVPGALYTSGLCDARGYLNDPALTAEKFIPDPFGCEPGRRLYRTGDLARRLAAGEIEYMGRIDTQVKIRGYRVELGEIETVLARQAGVRDLAVVPQPGPGGAPRLVAYVVLEDTAPEAVAEALAGLRSALKEKLPEYMVPAVFLTLEVLPLNANGKLDREALPVPDAAADLGTGYVAPRDEIEEVLADIVGEVLEVERVGVRNGFFELGGHSLLATQLMSRVGATFRVELPLRVLFEGPTVEELARAVVAREAREGQCLHLARVYLKVRAMSSTQVRDELRAQQSTAQEPVAEAGAAADGRRGRPYVAPTTPASVVSSRGPD